MIMNMYWRSIFTSSSCSHLTSCTLSWLSLKTNLWMTVRSHIILLIRTTTWRCYTSNFTLACLTLITILLLLIILLNKFILVLINFQFYFFDRGISLHLVIIAAISCSSWVYIFDIVWTFLWFKLWHHLFNFDAISWSKFRITLL